MPTSLGPLRIKEGDLTGNPPSGEVALYSPDGSALLMKDDAGNITTFGSGGGGAGAKISALTTATLPLTGTELVPIVQGGTTKQVAMSEVRVIDITRTVAAARTSTSTTYAAISDFTLTSLPAGTYAIRAWLMWQSVATATGIGFRSQVTSGTVTANVGHHYTTTTGTTATTGVADQATAAATFQMLESRAWRANGVDPGCHGGVDTVNADQFSMLEAMVTISTSATLEIQFASEVASSQVSVRPGSYLSLQKVP